MHPSNPSEVLKMGIYLNIERSDQPMDDAASDMEIQNKMVISDALRYFAYAYNTVASESRKRFAKKAGEWAGSVIDKINGSDYFRKQLDAETQEKLIEEQDGLSRDALHSTDGREKFRERIENDIGENEQFAKDLVALYSAGDGLLRELSYQELVLDGDNDGAPNSGQMAADDSYFGAMHKCLSNALGDAFTSAIETWRADTEVQEAYFTDECRKRFESYDDELNGTSTRIVATLVTLSGLFDIETERFRKVTRDKFDSMLKKYEKEMELQVKKAKQYSKENFKILSKMLDSMGTGSPAEQTYYHG